MRPNNPGPAPFVWREIQGSDFYDFAQRIFTRNIKSLELGKGHLCLLLDPQARVLELFWLFLKERDLFDVIHSGFSQDWHEKVELYRFAEQFEIGPAQSLDFSWEPIENQSRISPKILEPNRWMIPYAQHSLFFQPGVSSEEAQQRWQHLRWQAKASMPTEDFPQARLVFDWGLETYCDANKGCYVGQEIVERVKSRKGSSSFELLKCLWSSPPQIEEAIFSNQKPCGFVTRYSPAHEPEFFVSFVFAKKGLRGGDSVRGEKSGAMGQIVTP
jgi:folate-binding protein YgfZ